MISIVLSVLLQGTPPCLPSAPNYGQMLLQSYANLPTSGDAWAEIEDEANNAQTAINYLELSSTDNDRHDVWTLANALKFARDGDDTAGDNAILGVQDFYNFVQSANFVSTGNSVIGACRNSLSYIIAADIMYDTPAGDPELDATDKSEFLQSLNIVHDATDWVGDGCSDSMRDCAGDRPNNHGAYCGAAALAIEMYLWRENGSTAHKNHICTLKDYFKGFMGDSSVYSGFMFTSSDVSWHDPDVSQVPIGRGSDENDGHNLSGCIGDDMRRVGDADTGCSGTDSSNCTNCGETTGDCTSISCWSPYRQSNGDPYEDPYPAGWDGNRTGYPWEAMSGLVMWAHLLSRSGYYSWTWQSSAMERATEFLYVDYRFWAQDCHQGAVCQSGGSSTNSDNTWVPHVIYAIYGSDFLEDSYWAGESPLVIGTKPGKNFGFAEWWAAGL